MGWVRCLNCSWGGVKQLDLIGVLADLEAYYRLELKYESNDALVEALQDGLVCG
ncbi:MAG: hypothetical protein IGS54_15935 [Elainella sp. C42_A2020_010]|nr:hypothetical protein [Elainella sp. C42_A2020_010]